MNRKLEDYLFEPVKRGLTINRRLKTELCRARTPDPRGWGFLQCSRKPKVFIGGKGFCRQHAKIIQAGTGLQPDPDTRMVG